MDFVYYFMRQQCTSHQVTFIKVDPSDRPHLVFRGQMDPHSAKSLVHTRLDSLEYSTYANVM